jgi:hypothetical protein
LTGRDLACLIRGSPRYGQVAQLVEQRTENPRVGGSIPSLATNKINDLRAFGRLQLWNINSTNWAFWAAQRRNKSHKNQAVELNRITDPRSACRQFNSLHHRFVVFWGS